MSATMPCTHDYKLELLRRAAELVDEMVTDISNRGHTRAIAAGEVAKAVGVKPRRIAALLFGQAFSVASEEYQEIKAAFLAHKDQEAKSLIARSEAARERRRQVELGI